MLEHGYLRRKRWEARLVADALRPILLGGRPVAAADVVVGTSGRRYQLVSPTALLAQLGG